MCIIVYKPTTAKMPSKQTLRKCWNNNPDGAGYMFPMGDKVMIRKGFMNFGEFLQNLKTDYKKSGQFTPFVLHFRISTQGGVNKECTHPFPLSDDMADLRKLRTKSDFGIAHNGIIDLTSVGYYQQVTYSDTMKFITDYLTLIIKDKDWHYDNDKKELIERLIDSKMAIMDNDGHVELIGKFETEDGCYFSNNYYKETRVRHVTNRVGFKPNTSTRPYSSTGYMANWYDEEDIYDNIKRLPSTK